MSQGADHSCRNVVSLPVAGVTDVTTDLSTCTSATVTETPSYSTTQSDVSVETVPAVDMYLKILNPVNRKEFRMYTLRGLQKEDIDCPTKLKQEIFSLCGDCVVLKPAKIELGYIHQAKKFWLNNRRDMTDALEIHSKGGNLVYWCVGADSSQPSKSVPRKRTTYTTDTYSRQGWAGIYITQHSVQ